MVRDRGSPNRGPTFENEYRRNDERLAIREINSDLTTFNVVGLDIINRADASQICHNSGEPTERCCI